MTQRGEEEDFEELETRSQISNCSRTSRHSIANSLALQARVKAEAARTELEFAQREAELLKQAILNASLHELKLQKAVGTANAEAEMLEAAAKEEYKLLTPFRPIKNIMLPQTSDSAEIYGGNAVTQRPDIHPGHLPFQREIAANTLNSVTSSQPKATPLMTPHSPVRQPTMDKGEAMTRENQGEMPLSEISDREFIEQHHSLRRTSHLDTTSGHQHCGCTKKNMLFQRLPPGLKTLQ